LGPLAVCPSIPLKIILRTCQYLNPASLLPEEEGNPEHSCKEVLMENYAARPDLTDRPLKKCRSGITH
jgi:hypothetical protein